MASTQSFKKDFFVLKTLYRSNTTWQENIIAFKIKKAEKFLTVSVSVGPVIILVTLHSQKNLAR